jgi:hypothetical protein
MDGVANSARKGKIRNAVAVSMSSLDVLVVVFRVKATNLYDRVTLGALPHFF